MTGTVRILHVDDEPSLAELASTFLEREDDRFSVDTATSAREGLTSLSETDVDCVVSDYDMPEVNGIEFLETVREEYPDLPFILFTGKGSEEVASDAISAGVTDYLQKQTSSSQYTVLANRIGNVVEQYRTRRDVERAERKLSRIADKSDDVLFMFDGDWNDLLFVNEAYEDIWGTSVDDLQDDPESFLERIHPDDREAVIRSMDRISSGEEDALEYRVVRPDGEQRWVRAESKPVFDDDGTVSHVVGFVRDVTERTLRERELEDVRERFRLLVEHGSDMISVLDDAGVIQYQSPAIERILGYEAAGLVGESAFEYVHPDDRDRIWESFVQTIEQDEPATERVEYRFRRADGSWIWLETIGSNQTDTAIDGYVLTTRDITERRERERELERTNALLSTLFETLPVGELEAVDLGALSRSCWQTVATECATIRCELDRPIEADRTQLRQILENLLRNAIEYGGESVTVTIGAVDDETGFYVEDDGPGIPHEDRDRVFDVGYSTSAEGSGLGLSIVQRVVDAHDWELSVSDGRDGGTRFEITNVEFADE